LGRGVSQSDDDGALRAMALRLCGSAKRLRPIWESRSAKAVDCCGNDDEL